MSTLEQTIAQAIAPQIIRNGQTVQTTVQSVGPNSAPTAEPTPSEMLAMIAALQDENARLKANRPSGGGLALKITPKGGLSVYGLQRFPVTLYKAGWVKLLAEAKRIEQFIADNNALLSEKPAKE